jgi:phosphoribosylformylglycinamidine (FGAM) synthase PurS component
VVGSSIGSSIGKPIGFNIDGSSTSAPVVLTEITEVIAASSDDGFIREEFYYGSPSTTAFTSTNDEMKVGHEDNDMGLVKYFWSFLRFTTIDIPQGSTIASAKIQMKYSGFQSNSVGETIKISAEDVDDATAPTNTSAVINATLTTANSTWTIPSMTTNTYYDSQDITGVIQEIVDCTMQAPVLIGMHGGGHTTKVLCMHLN